MIFNFSVCLIIGISQRKSMLVLVFLVMYMIWIAILLIATLFMVLAIVGANISGNWVWEETRKVRHQVQLLHCWCVVLNAFHMTMKR